MLRIFQLEDQDRAICLALVAPRHKQEAKYRQQQQDFRGGRGTVVFIFTHIRCMLNPYQDVVAQCYALQVRSIGASPRPV